MPGRNLAPVLRAAGNSQKDSEEERQCQGCPVQDSPLAAMREGLEKNGAMMGKGVSDDGGRSW